MYVFIRLLIKYHKIPNQTRLHEHKTHKICTSSTAHHLRGEKTRLNQALMINFFFFTFYYY